MKLRGRLLSVAELVQSQRDAMFALMDAYYVNLHKQHFERDLDEKRWVIWIEDEATNELRGFSTQMLLQIDVKGKPITALFSGDTIIARECWREQTLTHVWGKLALGAHGSLSALALLVSDFQGIQDVSLSTGVLPRVLSAARYADAARRTRHARRAARKKYPTLYDPVRGVIRAGAEKDRLKEGIADQ